MQTMYLLPQSNEEAMWSGFFLLEKGVLSKEVFVQRHGFSRGVAELQVKSG